MTDPQAAGSRPPPAAVPVTASVPGYLPLQTARSSTAGMPPKSLDVVVFSKDDIRHHRFVGEDITADAIPAAAEHETLWLHFVGIETSDELHALLARFSVHDLVIEDILSKKQRPKIEDYGTYLFMAARAAAYRKNKLHADQIYLIAGPQYVLTFQSEPLGLFDAVYGYLQQNRFDIRNRGTDFLVYALADRITDDYFTVLEDFTHRLENLDKRLFSAADSGNDILLSVHKLKHDALRLRRSLLPQRDILYRLAGGDFHFFSPDTLIYLRDAYDHSLQLAETLDSARDMIMGMTDVHLSYQSNRLNRQMRVLTVITVLFMPLTVITGIYGMNFEFMPELKWHYGYFIVLGCMAGVASSLLGYFHKRRWL